MSEHPRDGSAWIAGLLLASLGAVAVVAWQAVDAALTHRAAAEAVLRDYARLAADELVRRTLSEVGYSGSYRLLNVLRRRDPDAALPSRESLAADERTARALTLARYVFALDPATGHLETAAGPPPAEEIEGWLRNALQAPEGRPMAVARARIGGELHRFVYAADDRGTLVGFELEPESLRRWFAAASGGRSLLPPSLAKGGDDDIMVATVTDGDGREVFRAGRPAVGEGDAYAPLLAAETPYGDGYEGIFEGMTARVTLHPSAASRLVIGGLPRSRLPALLGLLVLTFALLGAAIVQSRRARALARLRSDFVSQVSHELRTPLTQIRMFAETLLLDRLPDGGDRERALRVIKRQAEILEDLVDNILHASSRRPPLRPARCDLPTLASDVVESLSPPPVDGGTAGGPGPVELQVEGDRTAVVDRVAVTRILTNLLDNALRHGPEGQPVRVEVRHDGTRVEVAVEDHGPRLSSADREMAFERFERLEREDESTGAGIGLTVVRDLAERHGGGARLESRVGGGVRAVAWVEEGAVRAGGPGGEVEEDDRDVVRSDDRGVDGAIDRRSEIGS